MLNEPHKPDPLESYTFLTLFPRAFGHLRVPQDLDPLESVHIYLKSVALTSPQKLLEAAKTILEGAEQAENPKTLPFAAPSNSNLVTAKGETNCHVQRVPLAPKQDNVNLNPNIRMDVNHQKEPEYFSVHGKHEASENNDEAVAAIGKENHRDRRPGLGRKRARFSMNPNMSQPSINLEPTEDMYQLEDPEKYFAAFENLENAKREVQRQMGINSTNVKAKNLSSKTRSRRPGLLGRSVTFKHSYSSMLSEIVDIVTSPEETLHEDLQTSSNCDGDATNCNVLLEEKSLNRPSAKKKSRVDEVLDEVIYTNEDVDGDEALSQIQESLQIKPIDLDNLCLPKFHDIEISDIDTLGEKMPYNRESFKISMEKGFSIKSLLRDKETSDSLEDPLMSPTPAKSPFGSMSLLKRRLMQRSPLNDSFSFHDLEEQPPNNPSLGVPDQQLGNVDTSPSREEGTTNPTRTNVLCSDELLHENLGNIGFEVDAGANKSLADVENFDTGFHEDSKLLEDAEDMLHDASNGQPAINVEGSNGSHIILDDVKENGKSSVENFDTGFHEDSKLLDDAEDMLHDASNGQPAINIEGSNGSHIILDDVKENGKSSVEENLEDIYKEAAASGQPAANIEVSRMDNLNNESQMDELNSCVGHQLVQPSITPETSPVTQHKKPRTKIIAKRAHKGHCRIKVPSRRESLIDAGLLWNSGVRRSSRIKRKPLEYWKGERFLYGRVHGSLPTVIGVKYISPGKEGAANPTFRVQSFVSDEYKELVDLAALH